MTNYLSDTFFHFVGRRDPLYHAANYDKLAAILNSAAFVCRLTLGVGELARSDPKAKSASRSEIV